MTSVWANLREFDGSRAAAFEELCSQLARCESPADADFVRTGNPDAGVECYCMLNDGAEWGWQAKFFETSLTPTQWNQLDRSVKRALNAHPKLTRYYVCVPRNRADGRRPGITTEMQRWRERVAKWDGWAAEREMEVDFVWWGESELWERLSQQQHAGRHGFWFGDSQLFSDEWFQGRLNVALDAAGARYTPELHIDLPIAQKFELFGRTESAAASVRHLAKDIRQACSYQIRRLSTEDSPNHLPSLSDLVGSCDKIIQELTQIGCPPDQCWDIPQICEAMEAALSAIATSYEPLLAAERVFEESDQDEPTPYTRRSNPIGEARSALRYLENRLWEALHVLREHDAAINRDLLVVAGEAGTGKTHLLCDVAKHRIARGLPTVVLMGQQFLTREAPWTQILEQLDLRNDSADVFVGALEAAAQAARGRALVVIDALNEGEGDAVWPAHLASFLRQLRGSPWIGLVISVRTPYLQRIVTAEVLEAGYVVEHQGFSDSTYAAVRRYCDYFDLEFPTTPLLRPEFDNPLFLKTLCEGLHSTGLRRFPVGAEGITQVFDRYLDGVNAKLANSLDLDPQTATVKQALDRLAAELAARGAYWLPRNDARPLVDAFGPSGGFSLSLYRALVDNGLLIEIPLDSRQADFAVQFGFEWFADHLIAGHLVDSHESLESLAAVLDDENPDGVGFVLARRPGLQDALTILVPERHGVELVEIAGDEIAGPSVSEAFFRTLSWRDPGTIGPRCQELIDGAFEAVDGYERRQLLNALVTCATIAGHPLGAESLDTRLRQLAMPDRDAGWSTYLHYAYGQDGPVDRLLDWAEGLCATESATDVESVWACAVVLAWFLTTSNRFVRDRATKGLVALLHENFDLATRLVRRFRNVDDLYVCERVMAIAYGIAMRSTDAQGMVQLAETVYREVFADGEPPVHYLLRDYARGVVERALYVGAEIDVDRSGIEPPYPSGWPHIPDDAELEELDPDEMDSLEQPSAAERARRLIRFSVMHSDFSRYIIGTNSSTESSSWLSVPLDDPGWRSCDEQLEDFLYSLDEDLRESFRLLIERNHRSISPARRVRSKGRTNHDEADDPGLAFTVRPWLVNLEFEQIYVQMLSHEQRDRYDEIMALRDHQEPRLSLDIIQRYVLWRAFDLGWTVERFGDFDSYVSGGPSHVTKKTERIGKKYQWIAYHEILAYISDHFQFRDRYTDVQASNVYQGPWQSFERDIDPSVVSCPQDPDQEAEVSSHQWWGSRDHHTNNRTS